MDIREEHEEILLVLEEIINISKLFLMACYGAYRKLKERRATRNRLVRSYMSYSLNARVPDQLEKINRLIHGTDVHCFDNLRMSKNAFVRLCFLIHNFGGLVDTRNVKVNEQLAIFLHILGHHTKNRIVGYNFNRSGYTVSKHFNIVLNAVIKLYPLLIVKPTPIDDGCTDVRWKPFKGCLGALDGTYIKVRVAQLEKARYRNRKGDISVNVLGVCDATLCYSYILTGWEGSAADSRVLRDAVCRPHGLRIPDGNYYLCDNGYTNGEGFLAPYRGVRYHLDEWDGNNAPKDYKEYFNMKHAKARNVIERSFGLLKSRWGILRTSSHYPIKVHNRIIMACCLLQNFIRKEMPVDPLEASLRPIHNPSNDPELRFIESVETSQQWVLWRDDIARAMYDEWRARR